MVGLPPLPYNETVNGMSMLMVLSFWYESRPLMLNIATPPAVARVRKLPLETDFVAQPIDACTVKEVEAGVDRGSGLPGDVFPEGFN